MVFLCPFDNASAQLFLGGTIPLMSLPCIKPTNRRIQGLLGSWNQLDVRLTQNADILDQELSMDAVLSSNTLVSSPRIEPMKKLTAEEENHLLSLANPARIPPHLFANTGCHYRNRRRTDRISTARC